MSISIWNWKQKDIAKILEYKIPIFLNSRISRQKFLRYLGFSTPLIPIVGGLMSCRGKRKRISDHEEKGNVVYKRDPNSNKYQPPEQGCDIGFFSALDGPTNPESAKKKLGKGPKVMITPGPTWFFPWKNKFDDLKIYAQWYHQQGAVAWVYRNFTKDIKKHGFNNLPNNKEHRKELETYADEIVATGVPIIYCPMWEMNMTDGPWNWKDHPRAFKNAWILNWNIFEDRGANQLVSWAQEYQIEQQYPLRGYHPGDKYVDIITGSTHQKNWSLFTFHEYKRNITRGHNYFAKYHGNKPYGMAEMSAYKSDHQAERYQNLLNHIRDLKGIRLANIWNFTSSIGPTDSDQHLNEESWKMLSKTFKDDYWKGM